MRYYLIAGEASGDLHASNLMRELKKLDNAAVFRCWGGDLMEAQGGELVKHYRELAYMGFAEVVAHLPEILRNFSICEHDLRAFQPDVLILVDYPGFNLRMAKYAKKHGIRVFYYISPQLWAWRSSRVETVKKYVDRMFVILPFEQAFYARYNYEVDFRGHPLLDVINEEMPAMPEEEFLKSNMLTGKPLIALLPGSRKMEIAKMLRVMASIRPDFPDHQLVVGGAPSIAPAFYRDILSDTGVGFVTGQTRQLLKHAVAALVTSGTATLETALTAVPQIVCYRGNPISYLIARQLVHVKYISLVNLICDAPVVPELIQRELTRENLSATLQSILAPGERREAMLAGYRTLKERLGGQGASARVAGLMIQYLPKNQVNPLSKQEL